MRWEKVFISYDTKDTDLAETIARSLSRVGIEPYFADRTSFTNRSENEGNINDSNCIVPIISNNSVNSQWVNQELGFATAKKGGSIFALVEKGLTGAYSFENTITFDRMYLDDAIYELLGSILAFINRNVDHLTILYITCRRCGRVSQGFLPSKDELYRMIQERKVGYSICSCGTTNSYSPKTFQVLNY